VSPNTLRMLVAYLLIGALHSAWLYGAYGGGVLAKLNGALNYNVVVFIWLGLSSALAAFAYFRTALRVGEMQSRAARIASSAGATLASLYLGVYLAFNTYGT
jgi:hypothetical protein